MASHLVFVPERDAPRLFVWMAGGAGAPREVEAFAALREHGSPARARVVDESGAVLEAGGVAIPILDALPVLAAFATDELERAPASLAAWSLASKLALELVGRERIVPLVDGAQARWGAVLSAREDEERVAALARAMPPAAHAVPVESADRGSPALVWAPDALLREFLDCAADAIARAAEKRTGATSPESWERRFATALRSDDATFAPDGFRERTLLGDLEAWARPAHGGDANTPRACVLLEMPGQDVEQLTARHSFRLRYFLQARDDPSLLAPADQVWRARGSRLRHLGRTFADPQEHLLRALGLAARLYPPIGRSLAEAAPAELALDPTEAWNFLGDGAPALSEAGISVVLPAELTRSGRRRLKLRMRVGGGTDTAGVVSVARGIGRDEILSFRWEAALGDESLTAAEFAALAKLKSPLVRWRGQWVAVDPSELKEAERLLAERGGALSVAEAWSAALAGETERAGVSLPVEVVAEGALAARLEKLRSAAAGEVAVPREFRGTLRPYQERGLAWLATMAELGLGACLADDMGLGKTVQVLAFLLRRREIEPKDRRPVLLVCPTSVVGNWERECARFAPSLKVVRHYGAERARTANALAKKAAGAIVLTTYGLLRRDAELLCAVDWSAAVLDEAQNVKNAASRGARAARALRASHRFAMTGTPVENRLSELWSILEFTTPGLLGSVESFRRTFAIPIERWHDERATERLARIVRPFLLRRLKSDPAVIRDLPPKNEMTVVCSLTREQATLYQAAVDDALGLIEGSQGIARRGRVLALLTALKQICNHPAQYLGESGPLERRSGKLARLTEMLEESLAEGDKALVFTQFREMGDRLVAHLSRALSIDVPFLHGGTPRAARDEMVKRFQEDERGSRVFVLSLKAGGTGLNLTAANRVFHFDRWWNPAVEDQATDRAWRIGQKRAVSVHKLTSAGTVEEKIGRLLEDKRALAARVVGAGEAWITELGDTELRELFSLSRDAAVETDDADAGETAEVAR